MVLDDERRHRQERKEVVPAEFFDYRDGDDRGVTCRQSQDLPGGELPGIQALN
jgi:hypothetical protein